MSLSKFEIYKKITYTRGDIIRANLPNDDGTDQDHICIIVNKKIVLGEIVYLVYMTSDCPEEKEKQIRKQMKSDPDALVELTAKEVDQYFYNPVKTCIKCNMANLIKISHSDLSEMQARNAACCVKDKITDETIQKISPDIFDKIKKAIIKSNSYTEKDRQLLLED